MPSRQYVRHSYRQWYTCNFSGFCYKIRGCCFFISQKSVIAGHIFRFEVMNQSLVSVYFRRDYWGGDMIDVIKARLQPTAKRRVLAPAKHGSWSLRESAKPVSHMVRFEGNDRHPGEDDAGVADRNVIPYKKQTQTVKRVWRWNKRITWEYMLSFGNIYYHLYQ